MVQNDTLTIIGELCDSRIGFIVMLTIRFSISDIQFWTACQSVNKSLQNCNYRFVFIVVTAQCVKLIMYMHGKRINAYQHRCTVDRVNGD